MREAGAQSTEEVRASASGSGVPAPPGMGMIVPPKVLSNASREQSEGRAQEGIQKARPLPNLTPSPLNVVNVHRSLFKAHPLVRAAMCSDKSLKGEDSEGNRLGDCLDSRPDVRRRGEVSVESVTQPG
jgi:hypothetical protein